jgi:DNA-binding beta-propeller fold protein YncE
VKWSVNDIPGGDAELGTIDASGLYKAPDEAPRPNELHIVAEVEGSMNRYLFATVLVGDRTPAYGLVDTWGEEKDTSTHFKEPHGIAIDRDGNLLIADQGSGRVLRYTRDGEYLGDIGLGSGRGPGEFTDPRFVITDAEGRIWVSDSKGDQPRLQVFTHEGSFERIFAEKGILPGHLLRAHGMDFDREERLFVADVDNFRVSVFAHSGEFLYCWGELGVRPGQLNAPHGLTVDPSGDVFVLGAYGPSQKFDSEGHFLFAFAHADPPAGPVLFHDMAGDRWGNVYLTVVREKEGPGGQIQTFAEGKSIVKYNNNGDYVTGWSAAPPEHAETTLVVDNDGKIYTLFESETRVGVHVFEPQ